MPSSLSAGTSFPSQRHRKFQVHAVASYSNLCGFQSPYQMLDVECVDNLGFQEFHAQLGFLEGRGCKLLHSPIQTFILVV